MNILFFLTPKSEVAFIYNDFTLKQALEKMEYYRYCAVPIIDKDGKYVGTITEGDILWTMRNKYSEDSEKIKNCYISEIERKIDNQPIRIDSNVEDLVLKLINQNFIPIIDDSDIFIGIVTRKNVLQYCYDNYIKVMANNQV